MRILLVSPRRPFGPNEQILNELAGDEQASMWYSGAGIGLLVVAALTPPDIAVEYVDEQCDTIDFGGDYDLVAITAMTSQAIRAYQIAAVFRGRGVKVVIGGIHATLLPEEVDAYCDAVATGEAEQTWPQIIADLRRGQLRRLYAATTPSDLSRSPIPRYDLVAGKQDKYWVNTSKGCPFDCSFCCSSKIFGRQIRYKPVARVVEELRRVLEVHGRVKPKLIGFADDNMFTDRRRAEELTEQIAPLKIRWLAQTDISVAEDDLLLQRLKASGCGVLFIGFESLSTDGLQSIGNRLKTRMLDSYAAAVQKIQSHGIGVMGAFIIGVDSDDRSSIDRITRFVVDNHLFAIQISILTPLPGTRLRDSLAEQGRLLPTDWSRHTMSEVNYLPRNLTPDELNEGWLRIYKAFGAPEAVAAKKRYFFKIVLQKRSGPPANQPGRRSAAQTSRPEPTLAEPGRSGGT